MPSKKSRSIGPRNAASATSGNWYCRRLQKRVLPPLPPLKREPSPIGRLDLGSQTQVGVVVLEVIGRARLDPEEQVAQSPKRRGLTGFVVAADEMEIRASPSSSAPR